MKFSISIILMVLLGFSLSLFLPWWVIAPGCFITAILIPLHPWKAFLAGFLSCFLFWGGVALYISAGNDHILAGKIAMLFMKSTNPYVAISVTGLVAGLVGSLSALTASWLRHKPVRKDLTN